MDETYTPTTYVLDEDGLSDVQNILPGDVFDFGIGVACVVTGISTDADADGELIRFVGTEVDGLSTYERAFWPNCRITETDVMPEYLVTEYDYDYPEDPIPGAFCDVYDIHEPHVYTALNQRFYRCPGMSREQAEKLESDPECEHGLSQSLCAGPNHYPTDH